MTKMYTNGVKQLLSFAKAHMKVDKIRCSCVHCRNHCHHLIDMVRGGWVWYVIICTHQTWNWYVEKLFNPESMSKGEELIFDTNDTCDNWHG